MGYQTREGFKLPYYLGEQYDTEIKYLSGQQMWNGYFEQRKHWRKQQCLLLDLRTDKAFVFDPYNWQAEQASSVTELEISGNLSGVLLFIPAKETERVSQVLEDFSLTLPFPAPVYIFEERSDDLAKERDQRKEILKNLGLVKRAILVQPSRQKDDPINQFGVWRSRVPKERRLKKPINLVDEGPYWRQRWVRNLINKAALEYRRLGYKPLNAYEIGKRLRASRFALDDLSRLKLGFGFELENFCGCLWKKDVHGNWSRPWRCEPDCDGMPPMSNNQELVFNKPREKETGDGLLAVEAEEFIKGWGIENLQEDVLPYSSSVHMIFGFDGSSFSEDDLGKIIESPDCGCHHIVVQAKLPEFRSGNWEMKTGIVGIGFKTCFQHKPVE